MSLGEAGDSLRGWGGGGSLVIRAIHKHREKFTPAEKPKIKMNPNCGCQAGQRLPLGALRAVLSPSPPQGNRKLLKGLHREA